MNLTPTPGLYGNRDGEYEVLPDGTIWLIRGSAVPAGKQPVRVNALPADAAMTAGSMGGGFYECYEFVRWQHLPNANV